jgi:hypothetical protein
MRENRKQAVSIRLGAGDIRKVKQLAERLGVRDSDVIRFALKWMLNRVAPLCDPQIRGRNLVPVFVENGTELIRGFELDAFKLDGIINDGAEADRVVAHDDIALLALAGAQQPYALLRLRQPSADGSTASVEALRQYLYDKYVYAGFDERDEPPPRLGLERPAQSAARDDDRVSMVPFAAAAR